jgi:hypothetical protein
VAGRVYRWSMNDPLGQLSLRFAGLRLHQDGTRLRSYVGREFAGGPITLALLAPAAAGDPDLRRAFAEVVGRRSVATDQAVATVHDSDIHADQPWAAVRGLPGSADVDRLLAELGGEQRPRARPPVMSDPTFALAPPASRAPAAPPAPPPAFGAGPPAAPPAGPVAQLDGLTPPPGPAGTPPAPSPPGGPYPPPPPPRDGHRPQTAAAVIAALVIGAFLLAVFCSFLGSTGFFSPDPFAPHPFPEFPEP